ncbi:MAG: BACON domain-containing protein [Gemmatimonadota bacterium]
MTLKTTSNRSLSWTASENASWLSLGSKSGTIWSGTTQNLSLSVQRSGLEAGEYATDVTISSDKGGGSETVSVSMTVASAGTSSGQLSVSPLQVDFGSTATNASVTLTNTGNKSLTWTASESAGWLALGATSGSIAAKSNRTLSMSANRTGKSPGTYTTSVSIAAGTAGSVTVPVSMTVPSTSSSVLLAGQLVDQFDGHALAGLTVQYDGQSTKTNSSGMFTIAGSPTSSLEQLTLSGTGVYSRVTFARTGDSQWHVVPSSFSMTAFDDVARDEFGSATVRWVAPPTVYVDSQPEGFTSAELSTWISQVQVQAAEFVSKWTGAAIKPAAVIVTSNPPSDFSLGTIVIHFSENSSSYGGSSTAIGYARLSYSSDRSITGSAVWLRYLGYSGTSGAGKRKGILGHELGHAMGFGHMSSGTASFMEPSIGSKTDLLAFDQQAASLLYTRSPNNTSPDIDSSSSFLGLLVPSGLPVAREWVCDAGEGLR